MQMRKIEKEMERYNMNVKRQNSTRQDQLDFDGLEKVFWGWSQLS